MLLKVLICVISLIVCAGCSVKEDRAVCPCRFVLDFSEIDTAQIRSADMEMFSEDSLFLKEHLETEDFEGEYAVSVPRRQLQLCVWSGREGYESDGGLRIPYGEEAPEVYFHSSSVDADCEQLREIVKMRKNYCRLTMIMRGEEVIPISVSLVGNVDGYTRDGLPSSGKFRCSSEVGSDGVCSMVLPRQTDDTLVMELDDGSGVFKSFAIGEHIAESGYDWTTQDLDDITVELDFAVTHLTLVIQGWEKEHKFEVVI